MTVSIFDQHFSPQHSDQDISLVVSVCNKEHQEAQALIVGEKTKGKQFMLVKSLHSLLLLTVSLQTAKLLLVPSVLYFVH